MMRRVARITIATLACSLVLPMSAAAQPLRSDTKDIPVIELPAPQPSQTIAVFLSGDGGWAGIDKAVAGALQKRGISVIGINSLKYFWRTRTPDGTADDIGSVIRHYLAAWHADSVVLVGYSRGAGIAPFVANRLAPDVRSRLHLVALLGAEHTASFTFHVTDWFGGGSSKTDPPVMPEIVRFSSMPLICFYGAEETDTLCPELKAPHTIVKLGGGHHFDGDLSVIGDRIFEELRRGVRP
jgi:type IV secretory pathway VirJ component